MCTFAIFIYLPVIQIQYIRVREQKDIYMKKTAILITVLMLCVLSHCQFNNPLTYGSLLKLRQQSSNKWVHSHQVKFGRGGFYSVTGYDHDDIGNYWQILEQYPLSTKTYRDVVKCGDVIKLKSAIIGYYLRVDQTSFGLTTELLPMVHGFPENQADEAINWQIKCVGKDTGDVLNFDDQIKLKHSVTGKYVILDIYSQYTNFNCQGCEIINQIELHGVENDSDQEKISFKVLGGLTFATEDKSVQE